MKQSFDLASGTGGTARTYPPLPSNGSRFAGVPDYLARSYWWAYLWPPAVWFFDHQPVINTILFGQYRKLLKTCLEVLRPAEAGEMLQVAAVYGCLTPTLARRVSAERLCVVDVAPIQLRTVRRKLAEAGHSARLLQANAESLPCRTGSFDTVLLFFLLHELPPAARRRVLCETVRVLRPGGQMVIADYGELGRAHPLHRLSPLRRALERLEPYLGAFWREDLARTVAACAGDAPRPPTRDLRRNVFGGFYRIERYRLPASR